MATQGVLIGLTGPSGVGKGYVKEHLKSVFPDFVELSVVTTRSRRITDGVDRETDVPPELFLARRESGEIIFAHQPFGLTGDWYGFQQQQLLDHFSAGHAILTEVHIDNAEPFHIRFPDQVSLFGLVADEAYLRDNLDHRNTEGIEGKEIRLHQALSEMERIRNLHAAGVVADIIPVSAENRKIMPSIVEQKVASVLQEKALYSRGSKER